jgi:ABC-type multidrug transport system fused ATPase/permease subunit
MAVKPDASEEELRKAINAAELESFISGLPKNIETIIGERGVNVSGGQRQRLTIARTFIKNSPILLLDEPTSALDSVTEAGLQRSLTRLSEGKTTIIVAHRLKTIRNADRIFVVEKGEIVQIGTHDELIGVEGTYRRLYEKQDEENTGGEEYAS